MVRTLILIVTLVISFMSPSPVRAQETGALAGDFLVDWMGQQEQIMGLADAMPADQFGFQATPAQRTFAEQVLHIVEINVLLLETLGASAVVPDIDMTVTAKADVLRALEQSYEYGSAALGEFDDTDMAAAVEGPRFLGPSTRARIASFALSHSMDVYGQLVVYLRLNDIVPPASRRGL